MRDLSIKDTHSQEHDCAAVVEQLRASGHHVKVTPVVANSHTAHQLDHRSDVLIKDVDNQEHRLANAVEQLRASTRHMKVTSAAANS